MKDPTAIRREASEWFVTIHSADEPSAELLQQWLAWFDADEAHQRAFEDVAQIWHSTTPATIARRASTSSEDDYDGSISVAEWRARAARIRVNSSSRHRSWRRMLVAAAAAAAIAIAAGIAIQYNLTSTRASAGAFVTRTGEHMNLLLADGSRVVLGGDSRLTVTFTPVAREVRLDAGEAFFTVHKERARPFTVLALNGAITAVGTAFNVRALEDRVTVTVTEGVIRVAPSPSASESGPMEKGGTPDEPSRGGLEESLKDPVELRLARGQQLTYRPGEPLPALDAARIKHVDPRESARWRDGWLVYRNEPLRYVIADIGRYTELQLQVDDSAADLEITGAVYRDRIAEWVIALPEMSPVTVDRDGNRLLIRTRSTATLAQH